MTDSTYKNASDYIGLDSRDLNTIFSKINALEKLNQEVANYLDPAIAKYCQVANLVGGKLILLAANGSIATQIRFLVTDLLRKFKQSPLLRHIQFIECKVRPVQHPSGQRQQPAKNKAMSPLSAETADIIRNMADSLADPDLRAVMLKIAGRVNNK